MNMADQTAVTTRALTPSQDAPVATEPPSEYKPSVGDVVEFEYCRPADSRGIVFVEKDGRICITRYTSGGPHQGTGYHPCTPSLQYKNVRKIGSCNLTLEGLDGHKAQMLAKAYFSKPTFTADPDKSYAENQEEAVKFYGWVKGSKVRVMRKFKDREGGFIGYAWDFSLNKAQQQGKVGSIASICKGYIVIHEGCFPYFALETVK